MAEHNFVLTNEYKNLRLDEVIFEHFEKRLSRNFIKRLVKSSQIRVNGKVEHDRARSLSLNDVVIVEEDSEEIDDSKLTRARRELKRYAIDITYVDQNIIIVDKPAGLKVHQSHYNDTDNLLSLVSQALEVKHARLINRIDRETSGLVIMTINPIALNALTKLQQDHKIEKYYLAIVNFANLKAGDRLANNIKYLDGEGRVVSEGGVFAECEIIETVSLGTKYQFVLIKLISGRKHQLRIQLSNVGANIIGDTKYSQTKSGGDRMYLHSMGIIIAEDSLYPDGLKINTKIPKEFITFYQRQIGPENKKIQDSEFYRIFKEEL